MNLVHELDMKYSKEPVPCPNEGLKVTLKQSGVTYSQHGNMVVHGSGAFLICGLCGNQYAVGRI